MKKNRTTFGVLVCAATLLFAGCGSDGEESPSAEELSGVFQAGGVSGLHYVTPTRSGVTDGAGTFKYLAGETVTFSVGGIALGHAPGSSRITLFTLAGLTPPTTEPALRRELARASRTTSPFVRATNMMRLLLALDADSSPANGIDLRGRDAALANATLNFDQPIRPFSTALDKLAPDLTRNMPAWLPVAHLYRTLDIVVPAHALQSQAADSSGLFTQTTNYSYYPDGSLETQSSIDGIGGYNSSVAYRYDEMGRTTFLRQESDYSFFWGTFAYEHVTRFDARGKLLDRTVDSDQGADGVIEARQSSTYETDAFANVLSEVSRFDLGNDGTIDQTRLFSTQFNARLNPYHSTWTTDSDMDGEDDSRTTWDVEYDTNHRPLTERYETDEGADGVIDSRETATFTPAANGRDVSEVRLSDLDADGIIEIRTQTDWVLNAAGGNRTVTYEVEYDFDEDEVVESQYREVTTMDADGRMIDTLVSEDWDGDGVVDSVTHRTSTYDNYGNIFVAASETDSDHDGQWDIRSVTQYEYGAGAELLGAVRTLYEMGGPGVPSGTVRATNLLLANGVLMLAQRYLGGLSGGAVANDATLN